DASTGRETARIPLATRTGQLLFTPDGKRLVVRAFDEKSLDFTLIGLPKGEVIRTIPNTGRVFTATLSPDGKHLLAGGYDREKDEYFARRWELDTGRELDPLPVGKEGIGRAAYPPDGAAIAAAAHGQVARPGSRGDRGRSDHGDGPRQAGREPRRDPRRSRRGHQDRRAPAAGERARSAQPRPQPGRAVPGVAGDGPRGQFPSTD